jgi:hypothetical protein
MRMTVAKHAGGAWAALALTAACVASPTNVPADNIGWVTTLVDSATPALASARTFALPDTVVALPGYGTIDHAADQDIVAHIREHFVTLGWTEVREPGDLPHVLIVVGAMRATEVGVSYSYWYGAWGAMPYWGSTADPSWTWGAPVAAVPYTYEVGTLLVTMVDLRTPHSETKRVPVLWVAAVNGVLTDAAFLPRAVTGIDQAFTQSPYLRIE